MSHESPDGKWLYFSKAGREGIWRMPAPNPTFEGQPRSEELVIGPPHRPQADGWTLTSDEIVFVDLGTR